MSPRRIVLAVLLSLAASWPAGAQTAGPTAPAAPAASPATPAPATSPAAPTAGDLRPAASDARSPVALNAPAPPALRPIARPRDQALMSPGLVLPAAPRLDRRLDAGAGGAECRTRCAAQLYQCQGGEGGDHCDQTWSQCVLGCPPASAGSL